MTIPLSHSPLPLLPHPDFPDSALAAITVAVSWQEDGGLALTYRLQGNLESLRLPTPAAPVAQDRLWAHTCCEVFLARGDAGAYREYNFSPSGQWAGYAFAAYRQRQEGELPSPALAWRRSGDELVLDATLPPAALPGGDGALRLALSTVVEMGDGSLSYWALAHPAAQPDFHHRGGFTLILE